MSYIFEQTTGKHRYVFEGQSYRDANGKPRNKRTVIGKVDLKTGQRVYRQDYLARMKTAGTPVTQSSSVKQFSIDDLRGSRIKEYGLFYMLKGIGARSGLLDSLSGAMPDLWQEVFTLACHLVSTGNPFMHCSDWVNDTETLPVGNMTSQRISKITASITAGMRDDFYSRWCARRAEEEYLALDITSASSYSEFIDDVEWGYNRDGEDLPQVNICMLMGEKSRLPIYQVVYAGSLRDVSTLDATLALFNGITGGRPMLAVMDKGFYSKRNVDRMLHSEAGRKFIIAVPFTSNFARKQVEDERDGMDNIRNAVVICGDSMRVVTKDTAWDSKHNVFTHVYFAPAKAFRRREDLFAHVAVLREEASASPEKYVNSDEHGKYLSIQKSGTEDGGYTVGIQEGVLAEKLGTAGWLVLISNDVADAKKAMRIYRAKDVVEKGFWRLKCDLDLGRLRVHGQDRMQNKVFIGFVSLVLLSAINGVMVDKKLYEKMTMKQLLRRLSKLRIQEISGERVLFPVTKTQKEIYEAFEMNLPV
jgi:hypothetical protein